VKQILLPAHHDRLQPASQGDTQLDMPATSTRTRGRAFGKGDQAVRLGKVDQIPLGTSRPIWDRLEMLLFKERLFRNPAACNLVTEGL
jgi:hypothetical protein